MTEFGKYVGCTHCIGRNNVSSTWVSFKCQIDELNFLGLPCWCTAPRGVDCKRNITSLSALTPNTPPRPQCSKWFLGLSASRNCKHDKSKQLETNHLHAPSKSYQPCYYCRHVVTEQSLPPISVPWCDGVPGASRPQITDNNCVGGWGGARGDGVWEEWVHTL